jgi:hypothetical protein
VPAGEIEAAVINQLRAVFRQPEIVAGTWKAARTHADDITEEDARDALTRLDPLWDELFPAEQARIVALLVALNMGLTGVDSKITSSIPTGAGRQAIGLGIGAMFVRSMTIFLVRQGTMSEYRYLEHGAFYAILALATIMYCNTFVHLPEVITGLIGAVLIGLAFWSSVRWNRANPDGEPEGEEVTA